MNGGISRKGTDSIRQKINRFIYVISIVLFPLRGAAVQSPPQKASLIRQKLEFQLPFEPTYSAPGKCRWFLHEVMPIVLRRLPTHRHRNR
jgi:hypothetical protein